MMRIWLVWAAVAAMVGCGGGEPAGDGFDDDGTGILGGELTADGKPSLGLTGDTEPRGKADALRGRLGLPVSVDDSDTQVWAVSNAWGDTDTEAARREGLAWSADSGLSWEQKYQAWIASMSRTRTANDWGETFTLTTPWGTSFPAPSLECAEVAMFLRITFASWYNLPFFMQARDREGNRIYFGHFGIRTSDGRYGRTPRYKRSYDDYTQEYEQARASGLEPQWPVDERLRGRKIWGSFDDIQPMIGPDAHAGAYFDAVFLNKRVGYFLLTHLTYFGSIHLADSANTYNLKPEAVSAGDVLVERWQRSGIGHVLIVMRSASLGTQLVDGLEQPLLEAELASGSMPRRQPLWESPAASKRYFTMDETGGPGFVEFGGGLKRFRVAQRVSGRWANVAFDATNWINSNNRDALADRIARFEAILTQLGPQEKLAALLEVVETNRQHLRRFPASCAARVRREGAFDDIYALADDLGLSVAEIDAQHRKLEDYVFAELVYGQSKTCCWNSSTAAMHEIVMQYNLERLDDAESGTCNPPLVFMNYEDGSDGYEVFRAYADTIGRGDEWVTWSEDESCPQRDVRQDSEADHRGVGYCEVQGALRP